MILNVSHTKCVCGNEHTDTEQLGENKQALFNGKLMFCTVEERARHIVAKQGNLCTVQNHLPIPPSISSLSLHTLPKVCVGMCNVLMINAKWKMRMPPPTSETASIPRDVAGFLALIWGRYLIISS